MALKLFEKGLKHLWNKEYKQAKETFEKVLKKTDNIQIASRCKAYIKICSEKISSNKKNSIIENDYGFVSFLLNRGEYNEAKKILQDLINKTKTNELLETYTFLLAISEAGTNNVQTAKEHLQKAIELNPKNLYFAMKDPILKPIAESLKR